MSTENEKEVKFDFQSDREQGFPTLVQIALMHYICNSKCEKCPVGRLRRGLIAPEPGSEFDPEKKRLFPLALFPKIAEEMGRYPWSILRFHGRGEPLLHPHFVDMIRMAKERGVGTVTSFTNCTLLDRDMADAILNAGLDVIEMSIDAFSEKLYREFRGTEYFYQVVNNAEYFIRERNRRGSATKTRVIVSAVDCTEFQPEKEDFRVFWSHRADSVIFRPYHTYGGRLPSLPLCDAVEVVPCAQLWTRFSINPWGQVNACFNDWADREIVGDLNESGATIAGIWRNEKFDFIRAQSRNKVSVLECCKFCLATKVGWTQSYQVLLERLESNEPNRNFS